MKIVLFPGVRVYGIESKHQEFLNKITTALDCDGEIFTWEPGYKHPDYNLPLKDYRTLVYEVIMDFEDAVTKASTMKVPEADVYIGHSAGSLIAVAQQKPTIVMASPAPLASLLNSNDKDVATKRVLDLIRNSTAPIFNIVNRYDLVACLFNAPNAENFEYTGIWCSPSTYFPVTAHSDYWTNKVVINKIIETLKKWKNNA